MLPLLLAAALSQTTVDLVIRTSPATLSGAQQTALGNHVASRWPVAAGDVIAFTCARHPAGVSCYPTVSEVLDAATLFGLLAAGQQVTRGLASNARRRDLSPLYYGGSHLTQLRTFLEGVFPELSSRTVIGASCRREGAATRCSAEYLKPHTAAEALTALQAGQTLEPMR